MVNMQNGAPVTTQTAAYNTYVGARYVPLIMGEWDNKLNYEPLSIVLYEGNSYTSKQYVPAGVNITNDAYWVQTGNFNGQLYEVVNRLNMIEDELQKASVRTADYYGIKGDGTDETQAFNTALETAALNRVTIKVTKNMKIGVEGKVTLPAYTHLILEGEIIFLADDSAYITNMDGNSHPLYSGAGNILIEGGGKINGNSLNLGAPTQTPLRFYHAENITVKDITIELYGTYHAIELGGIDNALIDNVKFLGCITPTSATYPQSAIQIEPTYGTHGQGGAIPYDNTPCKNITVKGCYFGKSKLGGYNVNAGIESQWQGNEDVAWHENITIENNIFDNLPAMAVAPHAWKNVRIVNNKANNLALGFISSIDYNYPAITNGVIESNFVNGCNISVTSTTSTSTIATLGKCVSISITDNIFKGNKTTTLALFNSEDINIEGNVIQTCLLNSANPDYSYFYFSNCSLVSIVNNIIYSTNITNSMFSAGNKPSQCIVIGNIIQNESYNMERLQQVNQDYVKFWEGASYIGTIPLGENESKYTSYLIKFEFQEGNTAFGEIDINKSVYGSFSFVFITNDTVNNYNIECYIHNNALDIFRLNKSAGGTITVGTAESAPVKVIELRGIQNKNVLW